MKQTGLCVPDRDRGKKTRVAKGARRPRSKSGGLEPLTQVRVAYFEKERRELVSVNYSNQAVHHCQRQTPRPGVHAILRRVARRVGAGSDPDERLYRLGSAMVEAVAAGVPAEPLARYFEYWLLRLQGLYPAHLQCHQCGGALGGARAQAAFLAPGEREFTCGGCSPRGRGLRLSADALAFLSRARSINPLHLDDRFATAAGWRELESAIARSSRPLWTRNQSRSGAEQHAPPPVTFQDLSSNCRRSGLPTAVSSTKPLDIEGGGWHVTPRKLS